MRSYESDFKYRVQFKLLKGNEFSIFTNNVKKAEEIALRTPHCYGITVWRDDEQGGEILESNTTWEEEENYGIYEH